MKNMMFFLTETPVLLIVAALCSVALAQMSYTHSFTSKDGTVKTETDTLVDGNWIAEVALTGGKVGKQYFTLDKAGLSHSGIYAVFWDIDRVTPEAERDLIEAAETSKNTPPQDETGRISAAALASLVG